MGFLTTLTIYNDGIDLIKDPRYAQKFAEDVYYASLSHTCQTIPVGNFANLVNIQRTRHADDHTVYVHAGNCLTEMSAYSRETEALMRRNPKFFKKLLDEMRTQVRVLTKKYKEMQQQAESK